MTKCEKNGRNEGFVIFQMALSDISLLLFCLFVLRGLVMA